MDEPRARRRGFHVYRDGKRLTASLLPAGVGQYRDDANGRFRYQVTCTSAAGKESVPSVAAVCEAGQADTTPPHLVVVSPPTSLSAGLPAQIKVRILDGRTYDSVSAVLCYRTPGSGPWKQQPMTRRVKAIFTAEIPAAEIGPAGLEYYIEASDGSNTACFPATAPAVPLSLVRCSGEVSAPSAPQGLSVKDQTLELGRPDLGRGVLVPDLSQSRARDDRRP